MTLPLNSFPYYDDFDPTKGYMKVLFNPAKPVQARELNQIQSILQDQIKQNGDFTFKNGSMVIPGHLFYDNTVQFLKIETTFNQTNIESFLPNLIGKTIQGNINGINALIVWYDIATATDPTTLYIKYTSANGGINKFVSGESFVFLDSNNLSGSIKAVSTYTGPASICNIGDGVFYINGFYVGVASQIVTLSKYTNTPSSVVGLNYSESIITEDDDSALYDNAMGFSNYGAPGAHRLKVALTLVAQPYNYAPSNTSTVNFIELLKINNGKIEYLSNDTQYAHIESLVARRTFEQAGNFVTRKFSFNASNYRNNDVGQWTTNTPYLIGDIVSNVGLSYIALNQGYSGSIAPTQTFGVKSDGTIYWNELPNKSQFVNGGSNVVTSKFIADHIAADNNMVVNVSPGTAFVNGYENIFPDLTQNLVPKARSSTQISQAQIYAPAGTYVLVDNLQGIPNISTNLTSVNLLDVAGATIGKAWVRSLEYKSGSLASPSTVQYALFLFDINMNSGKNFATHVQKISSIEFAARVVSNLTAISGSVNIAISGNTVTGIGTYFNFDLKVGTRVQIDGIWTAVETIVSPTTFITSTTMSPVSNATMYSGTAAITKLGNYITPLVHPAINTLRNSSGNIDMTYFVTKQYNTGVVVGTSHTITLTNGETFSPTGHIVTLHTGDLNTSIPIDASCIPNTSATSLTINGLTDGLQYNVLAIVGSSGIFAKEKSKFISTNTITLVNTGTQTFHSKLIKLANSDCTRLIKVTESGNKTDVTQYYSANEQDITRYFTFDTGQRPEFYDLGSISTTRSNSVPIRITYEYFTHSSGDYFSVDSYSSVPRALIGTTTIGSNTYFLPDCLDFRSSISTYGTNFNTSVEQGASVPDPLVSTTTMTTSYSYFSPRIDNVGVDISGKILYNIGTKFPNSGMHLATVNVGAYTYNPSTDLKFVDDQILTYTMKDIKSLDSRLSNVEYYVALTKSEASAVKTVILDQYGVPVTKNGFLVDGFTNHDMTDTSNPDCTVYIDTVNNFAQSVMTLDGAHLIEPIGTTPSTRRANGYQITGKTISLPYVEAAMISQNIASTPTYIQSYASLDFNGQLSITPKTDAYVDNIYNTLVTTSTAVPVTNTVDVSIVLPPASGGKIICTKMYELGFMSDEIFEIDNMFGLMLQKSDIDAYNGYKSWAGTVIDWIDERGPNVLFMNKKYTSYLAIEWSKVIVAPWSIEMAYRMNKSSKKSIAGDIIMTLGLFTSRIIGKSNSKQNTVGTIKAHVILSILFFFRCIAACHRGSK